MKKKLVLNTIKVILGIVILYLLFSNIGFSEIYEVISNINVMYLLAAVALLIITISVGAANIYILTRAAGYNIGALKTLKYFFYTWAFGMVAPSKIGELSLIYFYKREGIPIGESFAISIIDKIISVFLLIVILIFGVNIFFDTNTSIRIIILFCMLFAAGVFVIFYGKTREIIKRYILRKYSDRFRGFNKTLMHLMKNNKRALAANLFVSAAKLVVNATNIMVLFMAFGADVNLHTVIVICSITSLVSTIPITISGIGIRESTAVFLYSKVGVQESVTASVYIIVFVMCYILSFLTIMASRSKDVV